MTNVSNSSTVKVLNPKEFFDLSGRDFIVNKNTTEAKESNMTSKSDIEKEIGFYKKYQEFDKDKNGITYDEYLLYLQKKNKYTPARIEMKNAKLSKDICKIIFHENGNIFQALFNLEDGAGTIDGYYCSFFKLQEDGNLTGFWAQKDHIISGIKVNDNHFVNFYPYKNIKDRRVKNIKNMVTREWIEYDEKGRVIKK